jgi:hypothetical protein
MLSLAEIRASAFAIGGLAATVLLIGCESGKDADEVRANLANTQQRLTLLEHQIANLTTDLATTRAELAAVKDGLAVRDAARNAERDVAKKKTDPNDGPPGLTPDQVTLLKKVISQCVQSVRSQAPQGYEARYWTGFDAYYGGSGRVQNNIRYVEERPALYEFNKCMASQGWPLS